MQNLSILDENWRTLTSLFPVDWRERARQYGAVSRLRGFNSGDELMRTWLVHIAGGYSVGETVVLAKSSGVADVAGVALLKRLIGADEVVKALAGGLFGEVGMSMP